MNFLKNNPKKIRKEDGGKQIKKERRGKRKKVPSHFRLSESNHLKWLSTAFYLTQIFQHEIPGKVFNFSLLVKAVVKRDGCGK